MLIQRLNSAFGEDDFNAFLREIKKHEGCCDEVWLSTLYGYPKAEAHRAHASLLAHRAKILRGHGLRVSLQVSNTLGHGQYASANDCSGLVFEGSKVGNMVGQDGTTSKYVFCYNDPVFTEYVKTSLNAYADVDPDIVWFDDDLRFDWHQPVLYGCFCDTCIKKFNDRFGHRYGRAALVEAIKHDGTVRDEYVAFMMDSMGNFVEEVSRSFHEICPNANFGHQNGSTSFPTGGFGYLFDRLKRVTGKNPAYRPGGGVYNEARPRDMIDKYTLIAVGIAQLPEYVENISPEIENLPCTAFGSKSPHGTCLETSLYFAGGATHMTYNMMSSREPMRYYGETYRRFSERRAYWETLVACNRDTCQSGLGYVIPKASGKRNLDEGETEEEYFNRWFSTRPYHDRVERLLCTGLSIAFGNSDCAVKILKYECAMALTEEELRALLKTPVLCDAQAFQYLSKKFDCFNATAEAVGSDEGFKLRMQYADGCPLPELVGKENAKGFLFSAFTKIRPKDGDVLALVKYSTASKELPVEEGDYPYGIAEAIVRTSEGGRWAVFGSDLWNPAVSFDRKRYLEAVYEALSGEKIKASLLSRYSSVLLPREDHSGSIAAVTVLNASLTEFAPEVVIRAPAGETFFVVNERGIKKPVKAIPFDGGYKLKLPKLYPWHFETVIVKE